MKKQVVYAFIDSQNLNLGVRNSVKRKRKTVYRGWKLDFKRFRVYLKEKYKVEKVYLFIGMRTGNESLYTHLQEAGYILVFKPTLEITKGKETVVKGNVDAELVLHTMIEYKNYDKAVIVSGDGDFHCLIEYLDGKGKLKRIIAPNRFTTSSLLWKFRIHMDFVAPLRAKLEFGNRKKKEKRGAALRTKP